MYISFQRSSSSAKGGVSHHNSAPYTSSWMEACFMLERLHNGSITAKKRGKKGRRVWTSDFINEWCRPRVMIRRHTDALNGLGVSITA
ncbi:hypothetical protein BDW72DRAFT_176414 [Aspergillus terricola var. indicus]